MAGGDEIGQVCQMEIEGVKFAFNASLQMASWIMQALKALFVDGGGKLIKAGVDKHSEKSEARAKAELESPGEKDRAELLRLSAQQGGQPQILEIPDGCYKEAISLFEKNGIRWGELIDFKPHDGKSPVLICPQDLSTASIIINEFIQRKIEEGESVCDKYNEQINELREKLLTASPDEKEKLEIVLENYEQARDEKLHIVDTEKALIEKGAVISFNEYLEQSKGTSFESDPLKAVNDMKQNGVEIAPVYSVKECLQPVRDPELMPASKMQFALPESGIVITREFDIDSTTNLVYSTYSFKTESGEMYEFSDRDKTKKTWNEVILPDLMDKAQITEEMQCRVFTQQECLENYLKLYDSPKEELGNKKRDDERQDDVPDFQNADVKHQIEYAISENLKASALEADTILFEVPADRIHMENGHLIYRDVDFEVEFAGIEKGDMHGGKLAFAVKKDSEVKVTRLDNKEDDNRSETISAQAWYELCYQAKQKDKDKVQSQTHSNRS